MNTNIRFIFLIVKLIPFALLSQLRSLASSESNMASFFTSSLHPFQFCSSVSRQQCCSIDCIEYMQFGFRFQILLFTTSIRFRLRHWHTWHTTGGPSSSCEMIILRNNGHGGIKEFVWEYLRPLQGIKKYLKFSKKIPHLTSTAYNLLSDRLL